MKVGKLTQKGVELGVGGSVLEKLDIYPQVKALTDLPDNVASNEIVEAFGSEDEIYAFIDVLNSPTILPILEPEEGMIIYPAVTSKRDAAANTAKIEVIYVVGAESVIAVLEKENGQWIRSIQALDLGSSNSSILQVPRDILNLSSASAETDIFTMFGTPDSEEGLLAFITTAQTPGIIPVFVLELAPGTKTVECPYIITINTEETQGLSVIYNMFGLGQGTITIEKTGGSWGATKNTSITSESSQVVLLPAGFASLSGPLDNEGTLALFGSEQAALETFKDLRDSRAILKIVTGVLGNPIHLPVKQWTISPESASSQSLFFTVEFQGTYRNTSVHRSTEGVWRTSFTDTELLTENSTSILKTSDQSLTPDEKLQVRSNIGAVSIEDVKSIGLNQLMNSDFEIDEFSKAYLERNHEGAGTYVLATRDPIALHYHVGKIDPEVATAVESSIASLKTIEGYARAENYAHKGVKQTILNPDLVSEIDTRIDYSIRVALQSNLAFSFDYAVYPNNSEYLPEVTINTYLYAASKPMRVDYPPPLVQSETMQLDIPNTNGYKLTREVLDEAIGLYRYSCVIPKIGLASAIQLIVGKKIQVINTPEISYYTRRWKLEDSPTCTSYSKLPYIDDFLRAGRYYDSLDILPTIMVSDGANISIPWKFNVDPYFPEQEFPTITLGYNVNLYAHPLDNSPPIPLTKDDLDVGALYAANKPYTLAGSVLTVPIPDGYTMSPGTTYMINARAEDFKPSRNVIKFNCNVHSEIPYAL